MSRARLFALLSAVVAVTGCYSYRVAPLATIEPKRQVPVTARDGRRVELFAVTVAADTLRGVSVRQRFFWERRVNVAMAVADLTTVEVRRFDARRSAPASRLEGGVLAMPL